MARMNRPVNATERISNFFCKSSVNLDRPGPGVRPADSSASGPFTASAWARWVELDQKTTSRSANAINNRRTRLVSIHRNAETLKSLRAKLDDPENIRGSNAVADG